MSLEDLKLLVDVAYHEQHGQHGFTVGLGFGAASDRLVKLGLLIRNPSQRKHAQVALTGAGCKLIDLKLGAGSPSAATYLTGHGQPP